MASRMHRFRCRNQKELFSISAHNECPSSGYETDAPKRPLQMPALSSKRPVHNLSKSNNMRPLKHVSRLFDQPGLTSKKAKTSEATVCT